MNHSSYCAQFKIARTILITFLSFLLAAWSATSFAWYWPGETTLGSNQNGGVSKIVRDDAGNAAIFRRDNLAIKLNYYNIAESGWENNSRTVLGSFSLTSPGAFFDADMNAGGDYLVADLFVAPLTNDSQRLLVTMEVGGVNKSSNEILSTNIDPALDTPIHVAISDNGDALVVWEHGNSLLYRIYSNDSWKAEATLDTSSSTVRYLDVATDENGNFVAVWIRQDAVDSRKVYSRRYTANNWSNRELIGSSGFASSSKEPNVSMWGNQKIAIVWVNPTVESGTQENIFVISARRFDGSQWLATETISAAPSLGVTTRFPHISSQSNGNLFAVYGQGPLSNSTKIYANRFNGNNWMGAEEISCGLAAINTNIDMDGNGNAATAFYAGSASSPTMIYRAYVNEKGWLNCQFDNSGNLLGNSQGLGAKTGVSNPSNFPEDIEKKIVITPHNILSTYLKSNNTAYSFKGAKDIYIIDDSTLQTENSIVDIFVTLPFNTICGSEPPFAFTEMRFSNNGLSWSPWENAPELTAPYQSTHTNWNLTNSTFGGNNSAGVKRVFVEFKNTNCSSEMTNDEIIYTPVCIPSTEICDGIDNNCDGSIDEGLSFDADSDGHFTPASCSLPADDCNDNNGAIFPGALEICDSIDNNCNSIIDEGLSVDADSDGHFTLGSCSLPADDCNDNNNAIFPGSTEICDGLDNNCNGVVDEGLSFDVDSDGHFVPGSCLGPADDCNDSDSAIFPGALEICDSKDNNCNTAIDEGLSFDADADGHYAPGSCAIPADDCDDNNIAVFPGTLEICDSLDNNCNGTVDEGLSLDADGDGHYTAGSCLLPADDCDDNNSAIFQCNTPVSENPVVIDEQTTGVSEVGITFPSITSGGDTTVNSIDSCSLDSPAGFTLNLSSLCYDIQSTAGFEGQVVVCVNYNDSDILNPPGESYLKMLSCDANGTNCEILPLYSADTANNKYCALTTHFSMFALGVFQGDSDGDGFDDRLDNCPTTFNPSQLDSDQDGQGDACDTCPSDASNNCQLIGIDLHKGFNLVAGLIAVSTQDSSIILSAFELLVEIGGPDAVSSIQQFNSQTGRFESAGYNQAGEFTNIDFPIDPTKGYLIHMKQEISGFAVP